MEKEKRRKKRERERRKERVCLHVLGCTAAGDVGTSPNVSDQTNIIHQLSDRIRLG